LRRQHLPDPRRLRNGKAQRTCRYGRCAELASGDTVWDSDHFTGVGGQFYRFNIRRRYTPSLPFVMLATKAITLRTGLLV
jgi:hypothetical protein